MRPTESARPNSYQHRSRLGALGERIAADVLERNGATVVGRNVTVGRGEIDLIACDDSGRFAVEVKTGMANGLDHPRFHFTDRKRAQVRTLARKRSIYRVDLVTVQLKASGVQVDWHRRVA